VRVGAGTGHEECCVKRNFGAGCEEAGTTGGGNTGKKQLKFAFFREEAFSGKRKVRSGEEGSGTEKKANGRPISPKYRQVRIPRKTEILTCLSLFDVSFLNRCIKIIPSKFLLKPL
jgi:hypothetical protein|tara:strand:- start:685 stop:1032 length:348 start_codon:yes stop_codon:yes gene_type:complete